MLAKASSIETAGIIVAIIVGLSGLVISLLTLRLQRRSVRVEEDKQIAEAGERELRHAQDQRAVLDFELVSLDAPRTFRLLAHNMGRHEAANVHVEGDHSRGSWRLLQSLAVIAPGGTQASDFTNHEWQVLGGSQLALRVQWEDGTGGHQGEFIATCRT
jgi:hypothetical protein